MTNQTLNDHVKKGVKCSSVKGIKSAGVIAHFKVLIVHNS